MSNAIATTNLTADEQEIFRSNLRRFIETEVAVHVNQWEEEERIPRELWTKLGELGYLGLEFPTQYGGSQSGYLATLIFLEELARCGSMGVSASVAVHTEMSSPYILHLGTEEQRRQYLPSLISGKKICAVAMTEPGAGSDLAGIQTRADRKGDTYILNGAKTFITNGIYGDVFVVAARTAAGTREKRHEGLSLFIVEKGAKGFTVSRKLKKIGWWASDTAELAFQDCEIPASSLLGKEGAGFHELMTLLQRERLAIAVMSYASAGHVLEKAIDYARERRAFEQPLSKFQVIRHKLADMATSVEIARQFVHNLATKYPEGHGDDGSVSMAKLFATQVATRVADDSVQIFGGYGCMRESGIERFYRDARILTIGGGSSEILKEIIAKRILND